jgi:hypothetical protein
MKRAAQKIFVKVFRHSCKSVTRNLKASNQVYG